MSKAMTETSKQRLCVQRTDGWCESAADAAEVTPELSAGMQLSALLPNVRHVTAFECAHEVREIRWYRVSPRPDRAVGLFYFENI